MYQSHGWWFPDEDTHFAEMLAKNVAKGNRPVYQEPVRRRSLEHCGRRSLALDIGANVGLWSRDLCEQFDRVVAFEPVPQFRECLARNVTDARLEIRACALGSTASLINMIITEHNTGHTHVDTASLGQGTIPMYTLDQLDISSVDYIKIDCEGYETEILKGAQRTIQQCRPIMVVENKNHQDVGHSDTASAIDLCLTWGARILDQVRNDVILGW
jgi:FkbM family methyltransferase